MSDDFDLEYESRKEADSGLFGGHDSNTPADYRFALPEIAGAQALAGAAANGSPQARRRARVLVAVAFGVPFLVALIWTVLGWLS